MQLCVRSRSRRPAKMSNSLCDTFRVKKAVFLIMVLCFRHVNSDNPCLPFDTCAKCTSARYAHQHQSKNIIPVAENKERKETYLRVVDNQANGPLCVWVPGNFTCVPLGHNERAAIDVLIEYEYDCPLFPPHKPPDFLPNWMGVLWKNGTDGRFGRLSLLDLSLPGTHDSMTYDLSLTVSEEGLDNFYKISEALHFWSKWSGKSPDLSSGEIEDFLRLQAQTQKLSITEQLDNGIRFIDFRIMFEQDKKEWYSIHFMQSREPMETYLRQIRNWLDEHPYEVVIIWLSRQGDQSATGNYQYPNVTPEEKQTMWRVYMSIFEGLMLDTKESPVNVTSFEVLIRRNHRLISYVSDYLEFTASSRFALDGALIANYHRGDGVFNEPLNIKRHAEYFDNAADQNQQARTQSGFTLMSMNTEGTSWQIIDSAKNRFMPSELVGSISRSLTEAIVNDGTAFQSCHARCNIPGIVNWCPETLLDIAQLTSYYNQISIENAYQSFLKSIKSPGKLPPRAFPNAFYLDSLDNEGTIRTGTELLNGVERSAKMKEHKTSKYAYVDTVVAYNIHTACQNHHTGPIPSNISIFPFATDKLNQCDSTIAFIEGRRTSNPLQLWDLPDFGRLTNWP